MTSSAPRIALAETCRVVGSEVPLWSLHRERLASGGCGAALLDRVDREVAEAVARYPGVRSSRLRLHVEVSSEGEVTTEIERRLSSLDVLHGPEIALVDETELAKPPELPSGAAKPADRTWWDSAARIARRRGAHQAVVVDSSGAIVDGSSATVWVVAAGRVATPPSPRAVAGVARRFVLDRAGELGLEVDMRRIAAVELERAEEVFLTNAFGGVVAVRGRGGPVSVEVARLFARTWRR